MNLWRNRDFKNKRFVQFNEREQELKYAHAIVAIFYTSNQQHRIKLLSENI
jgi:hypothetical protein